MGAVFRVPIIQLKSGELPQWAESGELPLYGTSAKEGSDIRSAELPDHFAVAIGNEGRGLRDATLAACRELLTIPIAAESESLNAAVAASIVMFCLK
jgi:TrmH family RNA methyltransferase